MGPDGLVTKVRYGWRAIAVGAVIGLVLFAAYGLLSRSAGDYSKSLTFELADPKATTVSVRLDDRLGGDDTEVGVADLLQSTAIEKYDIPDGVRVTARGIDGSRAIIVTVTGTQARVNEAAEILSTAFPADRAAELTDTIERAIESSTGALQSLQEERDLLDQEIAEIAEGDDVLRQRLVLDRIESSRQILSTEQQIDDLNRLLTTAPDTYTTLAVVSEGRSVGTSPVLAMVLGLVFGALGGLVVLLTRPGSAPKRPATGA